MIRILDRVITGGEALMRLQRDGGPGRIVLFLEELGEEASREFERRLNGLRVETGWAMGKMVGVAVGMMYAVFLVEGGEVLFRSFRDAVGLGIVHVVLTALWGKFLGMQKAEREFAETKAELAEMIAGTMAGRSDPYSVLTAEKTGKTKAFRLREQRA